MNKFKVTKQVGRLEIDMHGFINDVKDFHDDFSVNDAIEKIRSNMDSGVSRVHFNIFSFGGSAHAGMALRSYVASLPVMKTGSVYGLAASAATDVIAALDHVNIGAHDNVLIHEASGIAMGSYEQILKTAEDIKVINEETALMWSKKTGLSVDDVSEIMAKDQLMSAAEAVEKGFITEIREESNTKISCQNGVCMPEKLYKSLPEEVKSKYSLVDIGHDASEKNKIKFNVTKNVNRGVDMSEQKLDLGQFSELVNKVLDDRSDKESRDKLQKSVMDLQAQNDRYSKEIDELKKNQMTEEQKQEIYNAAYLEAQETVEIQSMLKELNIAHEGDTATEIRSYVVSKHLSSELDLPEVTLDGEQVEAVFNKVVDKKRQEEVKEPDNASTMTFVKNAKGSKDGEKPVSLKSDFKEKFLGGKE